MTKQELLKNLQECGCVYVAVLFENQKDRFYIHADKQNMINEIESGFGGDYTKLDIVRLFDNLWIELPNKVLR